RAGVPVERAARVVRDLAAVADASEERLRPLERLAILLPEGASGLAPVALHGRIPERALLGGGHSPEEIPSRALAREVDANAVRELARDVPRGRRVGAPVPLALVVVSLMSSESVEQRCDLV